MIDKLDKLIILSTCICRPELHNLVFPQLIDVLSNLSVEIIWIFNIDKDKNATQHNTKLIKCSSTQELTRDNLLRHLKKLKNVKYEFILSKTSNFYSATQNVMFASKKYMTDNSAMFWFEDDWILLKKLDLKNILDTYYNKNCYISLVFNELNFPPFILGSNMYKLFLDKFTEKIYEKDPLKKHLTIIDPENVFRFIMINLLADKQIPIYNFLVNNDNADLEKLFKYSEKCILHSFGLNKSRKVKAYKNKLNKSFLICDNPKKEIVDKINEINKKIPFKTETICKYETTAYLGINVNNSHDYHKLITDNSFNVVKFGGWNDYVGIKGNKTHSNVFFYDSGRIWKDNVSILNEIDNIDLKTNKMLELFNNHRGKRNVILTSYYFNVPDPQYKKEKKSRKKYKDGDNFEYMKEFYESVIEFGLHCIIFHDGLSDDFIKKYGTNKIKFVKFDHKDYFTTSGNDTRYLVFRDYLLKNINYDKVIISDINGVKFLTNPFIDLIYGKIFVARDRIKTRHNRKRVLTHHWFKEYAERVYKSFKSFQKFENEYSLTCKYFCGDYNTILNIIKDIGEEFEEVNTDTNTNYVVFNKVIREKYNDVIVYGISSHDGFREVVDDNKNYIIKIRNANIYGKLYWDN